VPARKAVTESSVNERAQHFLKVLIERYIRDGEPVGSRTLARDAGMDLSPATIRNVMADLEDVGLITSPHTSSGRVPTVDGYRMFIDSLLTLKHLNKSEIDNLKTRLADDQSSAVVLESASRILSSRTVSPRLTRNSFRLRRVLLIPLPPCLHISPFERNFSFIFATPE